MSDKSSLERNLARRCCAADIITRSAGRVPKKKALVFRDNNYTYEDLNQRVTRCANALAKFGLGCGDNAAILSHNCDHFFIYWLALMKLGAVMVPVNWAFKGPEIVYVINHSEAKVLLCEDILIEAVESLKDEMPTLEHFFYIDLNGVAAPEGWIDFLSLQAEGNPEAEPEVEIYGDDTAVMIYTSGTESKPKGVMSTHLNLQISIGVAVVNIGLFEGAVSLIGLPMFHMSALWLALMTTALCGTSVIMYTPDPQEILELTHRERVNAWIWVTTLYVNMLNLPNVREYDLTSLRSATIFGSYISPKLMDDWKEMAPDVCFISAYGQTECQLLTAITGNDLVTKAGSVGLPMVGTQLKIVDAQDNEMPPNQPGEIVVRSPNLMKGYFKEEEKTAEVWRGGWHHTGDVGRVDEDGYLFFMDRIKDMIKTGGENVVSTEVEDTIFNHPKVSEVAVFGLRHPRWQEAIAAAVAPKPGQTVEEEEIINWCKERIAGFKVPKRVFVMDNLPKNVSGKVLKKDLRVRYADTFEGAD